LRAIAAVAIVGLLALPDLAKGADLSVPTAAPVPYTWTGVYIGANAGYASAMFDETVSGGSGASSANIPGFVGGGQVGANYQMGGIVLGFEADFDWSSTTKSITAGIASGTEQIPWVATFRGRAGITFDRLLVYATAGAAETEFNSAVNVSAVGSANTTVTRPAWIAGGGLEFAITNSVSARVEDLYLDAGNVNLVYVGPSTVTGSLRENLVRAGLNYRLPIAW
jgi:outer membrane immunogenic protein